eukprot:3629334-Amphidinium_carterae.2
MKGAVLVMGDDLRQRVACSAYNSSHSPATSKQKQAHKKLGELTTKGGQGATLTSSPISMYKIAATAEQGQIVDY